MMLIARPMGWWEGCEYQLGWYARGFLDRCPMKALVLADVHANLAALDAVLMEPHDIVWCLGDLVGSGPEPGLCVERIRSAGASVVRGNHDHAVAEHLAPAGPEPFRSLAETTLPIAYAQLTGDALEYLRGLPLSVSLEVDGRRYLLVHATPEEPLYRAVGPDTAAWASELKGVSEETVLVGHTHVPFDLTIGQHRVVNPGSVGLPMDGDPRAGYAVLEDGAITLKRALYPIEHTIAALQSSGTGAEAVDELALWVRTGRPPRRGYPLSTTVR
jgi:predicted phosphodiesterase